MFFLCVCAHIIVNMMPVRKADAIMSSFRNCDVSWARGRSGWSGQRGQESVVLHGLKLRWNIDWRVGFGITETLKC